MAVLHFKRQKLQTSLIVLSLAVALSCSGLLLRLYSISQSRYVDLPDDVQAIIGPKSGGIEILLGALNLEDKFHGVIPENLFRTLRAGADIRFEDGSVVSSKMVTQATIPISFIGTYADSDSIIATDRSFFSDGEPAIDEIWLGAHSEAALKSRVGEMIDVSVRGTLSKRSLQKTLRVGRVLSEKNNSWDRALFVSDQNLEKWLLETEALHPVWKNKTLNYVLIQMKEGGFAPLKSLINDRTVSQLIWVPAEKQKLSDLTTAGNDLGFIIISVIFALAGFSIFGMMSIRAQAMRVSVATLEAIGYIPAFIYTWIFFEALFVGLLATLIAIIAEVAGFAFLKSSLGATWLVSISQTSEVKWASLIFLEGLVFSILGAALTSWQMVGLEIHSELKSG